MVVEVVSAPSTWIPYFRVLKYLMNINFKILDLYPTIEEDYRWIHVSLLRTPIRRNHSRYKRYQCVYSTSTLYPNRFIYNHLFTLLLFSHLVLQHFLLFVIIIIYPRFKLLISHLNSFVESSSKPFISP